MKEKLFYGRYYGLPRYVTAALIGSGIAGIGLSALFAVSWSLFLGIALIVCGVFWHLKMDFGDNPEKAVQSNFLEQVAAVWDGKGKVLDVGTGLGIAAIGIARQFPEAQVIGVDTWGKKWNFAGLTQSGAERNARIENVSERCAFQHGSALDLPFKDGEFQLVVSSFVFHVIDNVPDSTVILKEAIRVLAPGGTLLILDKNWEFPKRYGVKDVPEFLKKVGQLGVKDAQFITIKEAGLDLGGLFDIWGGAYLSGRKVR